jgi:anti-sigma factor RsiW
MNSRGEMDCKKTHSMIHEFLDGTLLPEQERAFRDHVGKCPRCEREVESYRSLERLLGEVEIENPPAGFAEPVIRFLKATGRIREQGAGARVRRGAGLVGWIQGRLRVPAVAAASLIVVLSAVSIGSGRFVGFLGKSTVAATSAYLDVQRTVAKAAVLDDVSRGIEDDVRTAKTVASAVYLLLSVAGQTYVVPALMSLLVITLGALLYLRLLKRSAGHASYCF